jgi:hypothetical protein
MISSRTGRTRKQLLHDLKETSGYWELKEEALDRPLQRSRLASGYGHVLRQTTVSMDRYTGLPQRLESSHTLLDLTTKLNGEFLIRDHRDKFTFTPPYTE